MSQIALIIRIDAELADVYDKVATARGIAGWFTEAEFKANQQFGSMRLELWEEVDFDVIETASPVQIIWRCLSKDHLWYGTDITFAFRQEGEKTIVTFDHSGWSERSDHFRDCAMSWAYFLESLRALVETGQGTPEGVAPPCESHSA